MPITMTPSPLATVLDALQPHFGDRLVTGQAVRDQHGHTTTWLKNQAPDAVVFVHDTQEVALLVRICAGQGVAVIPFGTGTSLEGHVNAPYGGICVDLSLMNKVLAIHRDDQDVVVQPGVTRKQLNIDLRDQGLFFPIDPGADASLGGMAATRASGTNAVRYGTMKDNVLALEAVMPDGSIIRTGTRARKSSAGYDLTRLLVGAEGTLGIITELTLKLHGIPEDVQSARCTFPDVQAACDATIQTIQMGIPMARIELLDALTVQAVNAYSKLSLPQAPMLLVEFHGSPASVAEQMALFGEVAADCGGSDITFARTAEERSAIWQARHDAYWAGLQLRPEARGLATDVCVPLSRLADCVAKATAEAARRGLTAPTVGHVGDGNFHMLLLVDMDNPSEVATAEDFTGWLADLAISMEGTCTGEHGIGQGKIAYLQRELGPATKIMAQIKAALDPQNIMNPGKILPQTD